MKIKLAICCSFIRGRLLHQIMKTFIFLLCTTVFSLNIENAFSQERVVIEQDQLVKVDRVFKIIRSQTNFDFIYPKKLFKNSPKVQLLKGEILAADLVRICLKNANLNFEISENNTVIIKEKVKERTTQIKEDEIQGVQISGLITDMSGQPLPGANILEKNTTNGTQTDFDGKFSLNVANEKAILVVSYIGFKTKEITVGNQTSLNIGLDEDAASLDEVVVVGYGTKKKSDLTGAVAKIGSAKIAEQPALRVEDAIQGRVAGVQIQRTSGSPDGALRVRIRGTNSLEGGNNPLYVVDGVLGVDMSAINVNDIQSVEVLKDASATAIYGSQGSNGVILVTTKRAKAGKTVWSFNSNIGFDSLVDDIRTPTAYEYTQLVNSALPGSFSQAEQDAFLNNPSLGVNWADEVFRTGVKYDYQFSAQGGSEKIKYYVSTALNDIEAIVEADDYKRFGIRSNLDVKLSNKAKLAVNLNVARIERSRSDLSIRAASYYAPVSQRFDENGDYADPDGFGVTNIENPLYSINETVTDGITNQIFALVRFDLDLFKNIQYSFTGSASTRNNNTSSFARYVPGAEPQSSTAKVSDSRRLKWQITNQLNYNNSFGDHTISANLVQEAQSVENWQNQIEASNFTTNSFGYNNLNVADAIGSTIVNANRDFQLASFLGRVNYSYKDKYLLTGSYRADASSKFAKGNKWAYFPSAAFAWKVSNEGFLADSEIVDLLKLRLSYGEVGNQAINPYQTLSTLEIPNNGVPIQNGVLSTAIALGNPANPDLVWETTAQYDAGIDLEMFQGKLSVATDYYYKKTTDLLYAKPEPGFAGLPSPFIIRNIGAVENRGFEFLVSSNIIQKEDFNVNVALNFASNKNKFLGVDGLDDFIPVTSEQYQSNSFSGLVPFVLEKGKPIGSIQGLIYEGPYRTEDAALATLHGRDLGAPRYRDVNGDGQINNNDAVIIGDGTPDYTLGLNMNIDYKNFDFVMFIQNVQGFDILNIDAYQRTRGYTNVDLLDAWSPTNNDSNQWAYVSNREDTPGSTQYLEDGSFIRLKNIGLGYTLPNNVTSKFGVDSLRFYINAQNLVTITDFTGYDPEASSSGNRDQSQGVNLGAYPNAKSFSLGLNLKF